MASIDAVIGGILCDLQLQESKQETRNRPGKSKGAGSPTWRPGPTLSPDHITLQNIG